MNDRPISGRPRAGEAFAAAMKSDPNAQATWERMQAVLRGFVDGLRAARSDLADDEYRDSCRNFAKAIGEALRLSGDELAANGFAMPQTLEDWEHLARIVEIPIETIQSGKLTAREIHACALAWADRVRMKAALAAPPAKGTRLSPADHGRGHGSSLPSASSGQSLPEVTNLAEVWSTLRQMMAAIQTGLGQMAAKACQDELAGSRRAVKPSGGKAAKVQSRKSKKGRKKGSDAWPLKLLDEAIEKLISTPQNKRIYDRFIDGVLHASPDDKRRIVEEFRVQFGPKALAKAITGDPKNRRYFTARIPNYAKSIQPVLHGRAPADWQPPPGAGNFDINDEAARMGRQRPVR